jgi:hypothetical protein
VRNKRKKRIICIKKMTQIIGGWGRGVCVFVNVVGRTVDVLRNKSDNVRIEGLSCNHCCCGKTVSITHSECVFIALIF